MGDPGKVGSELHAFAETGSVEGWSWFMAEQTIVG